MYYLFRAWGRIGTVIGGTKCEEMDKDEAIEGFEYHFLDKTGNEWKDKDKFVKKHGKYFQLQLDYGPQEAEEEYAVQPGSKTTLKKEIQEVIKMIFDVEEMRKTMKEFEVRVEIFYWNIIRILSNIIWILFEYYSNIIGIFRNITAILVE